jgi:AbrB family looped-hinge helix DNA binding protein
MGEKDLRGRENTSKEVGEGCCQVVSVVGIDERGQMVLPKEVREAAGIRAGDKLAVVLMMKNQQVCCISLLKTDDMTGMVRGVLRPVMRDLLSEGET